MNCLPARCWSSQTSTTNRTISIAPAKVCGSTSPWFAIEKAVQGGDTTNNVGHYLFIILFTCFWSFEFRNSYFRHVPGSRTEMSGDQPPVRPRSLAAAQILGGENTSQTS